MSVLASASSIAGAMPWISTEELSGLRAATDEERAGIAQLLGSGNIYYEFKDGDFLVHEGDLHVPGHFAPSGRLLVRGDLRVDGVYDDDRDLPYGIVAVLGDMQAQHIYSFASLHVKGDLHVEGVIATVYNDFTFKVGGALNAAGLIVSDKDASYQPGELGFQMDDRYGRADMSPAHQLRHENGLRRLRPEFLGSAGFRDPVDENETAYWVRVDEDGLRRAMHEGRPLLREAEAPAQLPQWLEAAFDFEADDASLLALVGKDPLVDQLMAAREELSAVVAEALARSGDPVVLEWLAITHPNIAQAHAGQSLQPGVAQRLAADPSTDHATLERIARSPDAEVRAALAKRQDPPEALIRLLARDPEPAVRDAILIEGFNVLALEPEALAPLIDSADRPLANALAHASLNLEEVDALLPRMDRMGHIHLAQSLWRQSLGAQPARMSAEQRVQLIDRLLATPKMDGTARSHAFLALDGTQQVARIELLRQGEINDRPLVRLAAPEFVDWMLDLTAEAGRAPSGTGLNRGLSPDRQRRVLELSLKAPGDEAVESLAHLAGNEALDPDVLVTLMREALRLGLPEHDELADRLLNRRDLPKAAIDALFAEHLYIEDVALSLLEQAHADAEQIKLAVIWRRGTVAREAASLATLEGEAYFRGLAKAKSPELREIAAVNHGTPAELIPALLADEVPEVRQAAGQHPSATAEQIAELADTVEIWRDAWDMPMLSADVWNAILARHQGLGARLKLKEWAAIGELEARRRAQR